MSHNTSSLCENCLPVAGAAPSSPQTKARAAASLVEAGTSGEGQEELDASGEKKKKSRRKKDPAAPKKALTAYLVFINAKREQVIKEHPEADLKDQVGFPEATPCCFKDTAIQSVDVTACCSDMLQC